MCNLREVLQTVRLSNLIQGVPVTSIKGDSRVGITGITKDSRLAKEGFLFFATGKSGGYIDDALKQGASALITGKETDEPFPCTVVVADPAKALGHIASKFYGFPSKHMHVTGITGTNGKTTTTYLIESMLRCAGKRSGVVGTISYRYNGHTLKAQNTTPGAVEIQSLLKDMYTAGVKSAVMEVSSHALDQRRVEGIEFDIGIFTNLTHDHLDYHGDFEHYKGAKKLLFEDYLMRSTKEKKFAILNIDDPTVREFAISGHIETISYSIKGYADAYVTRCAEDISGLTLDISIMGRRVTLKSPLIGTFNASNILAAVLYGYATHMPYEKVREGIETLAGVPGRLERVANDRRASIFVDYAHTPDALENVLTLLNGLRKGRLIVVFGCGGDRDKAKRPVMGGIASRLADTVIVTSDNPRSESPGAIIDDIEAGLTGSTYKIIEDRRDAIFEAVGLLRENDVLVVAGKGHEDYQIIGGKTYHFSDREVIEEALRVAS